MATLSTTRLYRSVYSFLQKVRRKEIDNFSRPQGLYILDTGNISVTDALYNTTNDVIEGLQFPDNCYLLGATITHTDWDTNGAPALTIDVILDNGTTTTVLINESTDFQSTTPEIVDQSVLATATVDTNHGAWPFVDVSQYKLNLRVGAVVAATPGTSRTFRVRALVYQGSVGTLA